MKIRKWYLGASGQANTARLTSIMQPKQAKTEEETADAIDKWREQMRSMETMGAEYTLSGTLKKIALRTITTGRVREYFDRVEEEKVTFDELVAKCYDYATKRRLDSKKGDAMELDECQKEEEDDEWKNYTPNGEEEWEEWNYEQGDVNWMGGGANKGKGNGK